MRFRYRSDARRTHGSGDGAKRCFVVSQQRSQSKTVFRMPATRLGAHPSQPDRLHEAVSAALRGVRRSTRAPDGAARPPNGPCGKLGPARRRSTTRRPPAARRPPRAAGRASGATLGAMPLTRAMWPDFDPRKSVEKGPKIVQNWSASRPGYPSFVESGREVESGVMCIRVGVFKNMWEVV